MSYDFNGFKKQVFPENDYKFKIVFCDVEAKTKSGDDCIKIKIEISFDGIKSVIDSTIPYSCDWIIEKLCLSIGNPEYYTQGVISNNGLLDKEGKAKIIVETWNNKESNKIKEFLPKEDENTLSLEPIKETIVVPAIKAHATLALPVEESFTQDSDIPF